MNNTLSLLVFSLFLASGTALGQSETKPAAPIPAASTTPEENSLFTERSYRLYVTPAAAGLTAMSASFVGIFAASIASDSFFKSTDARDDDLILPVAYSATGIIAGATTFGVLRAMNASWLTASVAAGVNVGIGAATAAWNYRFYQKYGRSRLSETPTSQVLVSVFSPGLMVVAAGVFTTAAVAITTRLEEPDAE